MEENNNIKSLVVGFCTCANCGWTDNKFNWHTYFKCPECGCKEYVKEDYFNEQIKSETVGEDNNDMAYDLLLADGFSFD